MDSAGFGQWLLQHPVLAVAIAILLMSGLYFGRNTAHALISNIFGALYRMLRLMSASVRQSEHNLAERNREVLLEQGRRQTEADLDKEFRRINRFVERELGQYPAVQRRISEQVTQIDEDYRRSDEVPPPQPDWLKAVEAVAKLCQRNNGDGISAKVLQEIHKESVEQQEAVLDAYRDSVRERHEKLDTMKRYWRELSHSIGEVGRSIESLVARSANIDQQMERYEQISAGADRAERMLKASALTQFVISAIVVGIAAGGAFINFHLIALPMSETVSTAGRIGGMRVSDIAGLFVILLEASFGLMLMESLHITHLFPAMRSMDDKVLRRMAWIFFVFLLAFACVEAALAFMRDEIATDNAALRQSLAGDAAVMQSTAVTSWIPMVGQMIMGFVLPFALAFVAIPLESLLHSARIVGGDLSSLGLRTVAGGLRLLAGGLHRAGDATIRLYDLLIVPFLWLEAMFARAFAARRQPGHQPTSQPPAQSGDAADDDSTPSADFARSGAW